MHPDSTCRFWERFRNIAKVHCVYSRNIRNTYYGILSMYWECSYVRFVISHRVSLGARTSYRRHLRNVTSTSAVRSSISLVHHIHTCIYVHKFTRVLVLGTYSVSLNDSRRCNCADILSIWIKYLHNDIDDYR